MESLNILIAEDDVLISEELCDILNEFGHRVVGIAEHYDAALKIINSSNVQIDIALLDIRMQGKEEGLEIAAYLKANHNIPYMFISSYSDSKTLEKVGKLTPSQYITKPFSKNDVRIATEILASSLKSGARSIILKEGSKSHKVDVNDLLWIKADGVYIEIHTLHKRIVLRTSIKSFLEEYQLYNLVRTHRSYVVNIEHVKVMSSNSLTIHGTQLPIARGHRSEVASAFHSFINSSV